MASCVVVVYHSLLSDALKITDILVGVLHHHQAEWEAKALAQTQSVSPRADGGKGSFVASPLNSSTAALEGEGCVVVCRLLSVV